MHFMRTAAGVAAFLVVAGLVSVPFFGAVQQGQRLEYSALFDKMEVMIPMRDGAKLHTEVYTPKNATAPLPILMNRTPYGISSPDKGTSNFIHLYADMVP